MTGPAFGKEFRAKYFEFDPEYVPLNNGSFGAPPAVVRERRDAEQLEFRRNPEKYMRFTIATKLTETLDQVAPFVGINDKDNARNLVFVSNATVGVNTVLRSWPFKKGDVIVYSSTTYGACAKTALFLKTLFDIETKSVDISYPMTNDEIVQKYSNAIDEVLASDSNKDKTVMAFFDTVSSQPGCKLPWKELVALCKQKQGDVLSFVDGAHAIGLLTDIDLDTVKPDFFVTNLHKWFFCPTPCTVLYVDQKHHDKVQTFPISHSYIPDVTSTYAADSSVRKNLLHDKFLFVGTMDYTNYIASQEAIKFRRDVCGGEEAIRDYTYKLAKDAAQLFCNEFGTKTVTAGNNLDEDTTPTAMINVFLPTPSGPVDLEAPVDANGKHAVDLEFAANELQYALLFKYNVYFPIGVINNQLYTRLSAQVYLDLDDFQAGIDAFKKEYAEFQTQYVEKDLKALSL